MAKSSTSFGKGKTGNAGGRPRETAEWKEWCRGFAADNRDGIAARALDDNRFLAFLIEQGHGRASQSLEAKVDVTVGLRAMSDAELKAAIKAELEQLDDAGQR